ncbi:MAG: hypothetical protein SchgKO_16700 [Schleiferiaceae bacterium]
MTLASCSSSQTTAEEKTTSESPNAVPTKTPPQQAIDQFNLSQYTFTDAFLENVVFSLQKNGKVGLMNLHGRWVLPNKYTGFYWHMPDGMVGARNGDVCGVLNFKGDTVVPFELPGMPVFEGTKDRDGHKKPGIISLRSGDGYNGYTYYFYTFEGEKIEKPEWYSTHYGSVYQRNVDPLHVDFELRNHAGRTLLVFANSEYLVWIEPFHEGMAAIFMAPYNHSNPYYTGSPRTYGFIDSTGQLAIPFGLQKERIHSFRTIHNDESTNRWFFEKGTALSNSINSPHYFYINKKGEKVLQFKETYSVKPPTSKGYRAIEDKGYDKDFNVVMDLGDTINKYGFAEMPTTRWIVDDNQLFYTEGQRTQLYVKDGNREVIEEFVQEDSNYVYQFWNVSQLHKLRIIKRLPKDTLTYREVQNLGLMYTQPGEVQVQDSMGNVISGWMDGGYEYDWDLGIYVNKFGFGRNQTLTDVEIYNFDGELIYSADSCNIYKRSWNMMPHLKGGSWMAKDSKDNYTLIFRNGENITYNSQDEIHPGNTYDWNSQNPPVYREFENADFNLLLTKEDLDGWYEKLFK